MGKGPPGIDPTVPNAARIYDYLLGGKENFAADREAARRLLEISPNLREGSRANRRFLIRAVRFMVANGIRQFLDIGTGLPTQENVHEVALKVAPESRIAYVDNDPVVLVHARALLADNPNTIVVEGDLREPEAILNDPQINAHLDLTRPIGLLLVAVLHFIVDDEEAERIVRTLRDRLAPGSHLAISHATIGDLDEEQEREGRAIYARSSTRGAIFRSHERVLRFFDGFELVEPGLVWLDDWRPEEGVPRIPRFPGLGGYAGVGILR